MGAESMWEGEDEMVGYEINADESTLGFIVASVGGSWSDGIKYKQKTLENRDWPTRGKVEMCSYSSWIS